MGVRHTRRRFLKALLHHIRIVAPILSGIVLVMVVCGIAVGKIEGWPLGDSLYFTFVTGLTIGYGDFTPHYLSSRVLSLVIGFSGIVLTGLVAAISVQALHSSAPDRDG